MTNGCEWVVQLTEAEFVGWWYGEPAGYRDELDIHQRINSVHRAVVDWSFDQEDLLRVTAARLQPPVILDRVTATGWRLMHKESGSPLAWSVAVDRTAALAAASDFVRRNLNIAGKVDLVTPEDYAVAVTFDDFMGNLRVTKRPGKEDGHDFDIP